MWMPDVAAFVCDFLDCLAFEALACGRGDAAECCVCWCKRTYNLKQEAFIEGAYDFLLDRITEFTSGAHISVQRVRPVIGIIRTIAMDAHGNTGIWESGRPMLAHGRYVADNLETIAITSKTTEDPLREAYDGTRKLDMSLFHSNVRNAAEEIREYLAELVSLSSSFRTNLNVVLNLNRELSRRPVNAIVLIVPDWVFSSSNLAILGSSDSLLEAGAHTRGCENPLVCSTLIPASFFESLLNPHDHCTNRNVFEVPLTFHDSL